jgi:hypothetical protein
MATDRIIEHIDRLREKPEHVRHRIAVLTAAGVTGLVAVTWMGALATSGTLALTSNETAPATEMSESITESTSAFSNLMGAAGAAFSASSSAASLDIVETRTSSTLDGKAAPANNTNKTVIPF